MSGVLSVVSRGLSAHESIVETYLVVRRLRRRLASLRARVHDRVVPIAPEQPARARRVIGRRRAHWPHAGYLPLEPVVLAALHERRVHAFLSVGNGLLFCFVLILVLPTTLDTNQVGVLRKFLCWGNFYSSRESNPDLSPCRGHHPSY